MTLELVREYLAGVEQALERLSRRHHDAATVRATAHRLVGGARVLGLNRFEGLWAAVSRASEAGDASISPAMLDELLEAGTDLTNWVDSQQRKQHV